MFCFILEPLLAHSLQEIMAQKKTGTKEAQIDSFQGDNLDQASVLNAMFKQNKKMQEEIERLQAVTSNPTGDKWYMVPRKAEKHLRELQANNPTGALILSLLREHMSTGGNALTVSTLALADELNLSRSSITRGVKYLRDKNYVQVIRTGGTNSYIVNQRIAFSGRPYQRTAVFNSVVLASEKEQQKGFEDAFNEPLKEVPVIEKNERAVLNTAEQLPPPDQADLDFN